MTSEDPPPVGRFVEMATALAAAQIHLCATAWGMARNFQRVASIPPRAAAKIGGTSGQERRVVVEIERDGRAGIDLKFGSLAFKKGPAGDYALALVDVIVAVDDRGGTRVQMELQVAAAPDSETIVAITEKCRRQIVANLREAADRFDATTAHALIFHDS